MQFGAAGVAGTLQIFVSRYIQFMTSGMKCLACTCYTSADNIN
jgi:hypothetical protein